MGLRSRAELADLLLSRGWPPSTPSAILLDASLPEASTWVGPLQVLGRIGLPEDCRDTAGTLVIGRVVSVAQSIAQLGDTVSAATAEGRVARSSSC
jgi:siroheme synthase